MPEKPKSTRIHDLAATLMGLIALGMLISAPWQVDSSGPDPFYKGPLIFPLMVLALMVAGALPSMIRLVRTQMVRPGQPGSWYLDGQGAPRKPAVMVLMLVLYIVALVGVGLEISTWVFLVTALKFLKQDSPMKLILVPFLVTALLYLVFKIFLDIWFPEPLLFSLFTE